GRTGAVNVHGVRSLQNNFVLDGVDNNSFSENVQELTTQIVRPSVDAIQEFKIATNPYSAENGRSPGSLVTVTTKSGANAFHGLAYEYLRNKVFDANDFFTNRVGRPRQKHVQNQYGGQIGGPVVKNKAFFFFNYEGTRIRRAVSIRQTCLPLRNGLAIFRSRQPLSTTSRLIPSVPAARRLRHAPAFCRWLTASATVLAPAIPFLETRFPPVALIR